MMKNEDMKKGKDVGAAKGEASPGSDNSAMDKSMKDMQQKGPKGSKPVINESASPGDNSMAQRGMTSDEAEKHWKGTGYKVPMSQADDHRSKK
jgi:hypothetical protein